MSLYVTPERDEAIELLAAATAGTREPWTMDALRRAADPDADLLFPGGLVELVEAWADLADRRMIEAAAQAGVDSVPSLTGRVRAAIMLRLDAAEPNRAQVRRALAQLALPGNASIAARMTARTVDAIWRAAGDSAAGLSWYTKRATLAGVYGATLLWWVAAERSREDTLAFIDRRLAGVARLGRLRRRPSNPRAA